LTERGRGVGARWFVGERDLSREQTEKSGTSRTAQRHKKAQRGRKEAVRELVHNSKGFGVQPIGDGRAGGTTDTSGGAP